MASFRPRNKGHVTRHFGENDPQKILRHFETLLTFFEVYNLSITGVVVTDYSATNSCPQILVVAEY